MRDRIVDLKDVGEFRQTLEARPPGIVHGTALVFALLVGGAIAWAALTEANVVVRAAARIRPADAPLRGFEEASNEHVHAEAAGRVVELAVTEGQTVAAGDVVVRLDTTRIDNEVARLGAEVGAKRAEVEAVDKMIALYAEQEAAAEKRADAEVRRSKRSVSHSRQRRRSDRELARVELVEATRELERAERLAQDGVGATADVDAARARRDRARAGLAASQVGVDDGEPEVLRRALEQTRTDQRVRVAELERQRAVLAGELAAGDKRLANLRLDQAHATIRAHKSGVVTLGGLAVGDLVDIGVLPLAITESGALRIDAAIATADVGEVKVGMRVRVRVDALDYTRYGTADGVIAHLGADAVRTANGVPYYLASVTLDPSDLALKPGMTGELEVITDRQPLLLLLVRSLRGAISL